MKKIIQVFHWIPRIICILAILFISLFAADSFAPELTLKEQLVGFLIHLIPSFILLLLLVVTWKWEFVGGIIFTIIGTVMSPFVFMMNYNMNHSIGMSLGIVALITVPFILTGILFIISHYLKKKHLSRRF
jgi:hypothetical protein